MCVDVDTRPCKFLVVLVHVCLAARTTLDKSWHNSLSYCDCDPIRTHFTRGLGEVYA